MIEKCDKKKEKRMRTIKEKRVEDDEEEWRKRMIENGRIIKLIKKDRMRMKKGEESNKEEKNDKEQMEFYYE